MENIWSEIRNEFEDEGIVHIDAWLSPNDNEEGTVIAKVHPDGKVEYIDGRARKDAYAQEMIIESVQEQLYRRVIERIKKDFFESDTTAIIELLEHVPLGNLIQYLPEEEWEHFKFKL
jgi:hypothetical protein